MRAGRAAGIEHVIHKDDVFIRHVKGQLGLPHLRHLAQGGQVVPIKADIDAAAGQLRILDLPDVLPDVSGDRLAPPPDPDQDHAVHALVLFDDLV